MKESSVTLHSHPEIRNFASYEPMPWKNGKGITREILRIESTDAASPHFRLSMATLTEVGLFSQFPGIDRTIVPLDGHGFSLSHNGSTPHWVKFGQAYSFKGDDQTEMTALDGTTLDLNAMVERQWGSCVLAIVEGDVPLRFEDQKTLALAFVIPIGPSSFVQLRSTDFGELTIPRLATCLWQWGREEEDRLPKGRLLGQCVTSASKCIFGQVYNHG